MHNIVTPQTSYSLFWVYTNVPCVRCMCNNIHIHVRTHTYTRSTRFTRCVYMYIHKFTWRSHYYQSFQKLYSYCASPWMCPTIVGELRTLSNIAGTRHYTAEMTPLDGLMMSWLSAWTHSRKRLLDFTSRLLTLFLPPYNKCLYAFLCWISLLVANAHEKSENVTFVSKSTPSKAVKIFVFLPAVTVGWTSIVCICR